MSNPNLPNITPALSLTREDAINLLFSAIAMEELGLAHILNAEGEKIQYALGLLPGTTPAAPAQLLEVNGSVKEMLETVFRQEIMLDSRLRSASSIPTVIGPTGPTGATGLPGAVFSVNGQTGDVLLSAAVGVFPIDSQIRSDTPLYHFNLPGVYNSSSPTGPPPPDTPPVLHPAVWTLYVSRVDNYVQQLYISNPSLYYRSSLDGGNTYPPHWTPIGEKGATGPTGSTGITGMTGISGMGGQALHGNGSLTFTLAAGSKIPFNSVIASIGSNISMVTGTVADAGLITLTGNHVYLAMYSVAVTANDAQFQFFLDGTAVTGTRTEASGNSNASHVSSCIINLLGKATAILTVRFLTADTVPTTTSAGGCGVTVSMLM